MSSERIENPELKKLLRKLGRAGKDAPADLMIDILKLAAVSKFIVPTETSSDGRVGLHAVSDGKGHKYLSVYSDTDSFETSMIDSGRDTEIPVVDASFEDLMDTVLTPGFGLDGFMLNPGCGDFLFGKEMLKMIKGEPSEEENTKISNVLDDFRVGVPNQYPPKALTMIKEFASMNPDLLSAYLKLCISKSDASDVRWLLAVSVTESLSEGQQRYLMDTLGRFMKNHLDNMPVMVGLISDSYISPAIDGEAPFWKA